MADLNLLAEVLELFAEGSPYHAALAEAIADVERLDKVERMLKFHGEVRSPDISWTSTIREAIDGVPEEQICG